MGKLRLGLALEAQEGGRLRASGRLELLYRRALCSPQIGGRRPGLTRLVRNEGVASTSRAQS